MTAGPLSLVRGLRRRLPQVRAEETIPVESLVQRPNNLWMPSDCPRCASGMPLERPAVS